MYNFHTHTTWCDGKSTPEKIISKAIELGYKSLGFSGHAPTKLQAEWQMTPDGFAEYKQKILKLKKTSASQIQIYLGVEADYIPNIAGSSNFKKDNLDYIIGSVHYVSSNLFQDKFLTIDASPEVFENGVKHLFNNNIKAAVVRYYETIREMLMVDKPDIIGHLDLVKKFNKGNRYFNEQEAWYKDEINKTIEVIRTTNCMVEINTRGFYKNLMSDFYPSNEIIEKCHEFNIPLVINTDTHHFEELAKGRNEVLELLEKLNIKSHKALFDNKWIDVTI